MTVRMIPTQNPMMIPSEGNGGQCQRKSIGHLIRGTNAGRTALTETETIGIVPEVRNIVGNSDHAAEIVNVPLNPNAIAPVLKSENIVESPHRHRVPAPVPLRPRGGTILTTMKDALRRLRISVLCPHPVKSWN